MKNLVKILFFALLAVGTTSCVRRELMDDCICSTQSAIPIHIDWEKSGVTPKNVTVLLYNQEDGSLAIEHRFQHNDAEIQSYVYAPIGKYTVVVFNEMRNQIQYVDCVGYENLSTLKFVAHKSASAISRGDELDYIQQAGGLAVEVIDDLEVTKELILYTASLMQSKADHNDYEADSKSVEASQALMNIEAKRRTSWLTIKAHFKNLNYARMPALVDLSNIADGYFVGRDKNSMNPAKLQFTMNNRTYDENSATNGTISTTVALFGTLGDRFSTKDHTSATPLMIDILFMLVDEEKTLVNYNRDATNLIEFKTDDSSNVTLNLDLDFEEKIPVVIPEGWEDSGFSTGVEDWSVVDVPLING